MTRIPTAHTGHEQSPHPGGVSSIGGDLAVGRIRFGAMQLIRAAQTPGSAQFRQGVEILQEAVRLGANHIDTSHYYGPNSVNGPIREALWPYPAHLHIVTKVGYRYDAMRGPVPATSGPDIIKGVEANLERLGLSTLDLVYFRAESPSPANPEAIARSFEVLADLRRQGLIRHLGVSNIGEAQLRAASDVAAVVAVQNRYGLGHREEDPMIELCRELGIAYVSFVSVRASLGDAGGTGSSPSWGSPRRSWPWR